jgi:exopolyphosphatase/pppGpp-phosphohydrolase
VVLGLRPAVGEAAALGLRPEAGEPWTVLTRADVERARELAMTLPSAELAQQTGLSPKRARLMAGGILILVGLLDRYRAEELTVTERGLRDGVILALAAARNRAAPPPP